MILLARHGETEWNVERRMQGRQDSPLTERGRRQAQAVARLVRDLTAREAGPWRLVSSPLGRARATAALIAEATGLPLETDDRLMEVTCGPWEGRLWDDVAAHHKLEAERRRWIFEALGGESYDSVEARVTSFLADLAPEPERRVVAVTHGAAGRVLRGAYAGLARDAVYELDIPQDAVHRLQNGQIERFDCAPID
jgi:broad specificity phosphatase PhoE